MDRERRNTNSYCGRLAFRTVRRFATVHIINTIGVIPHVLIADAISKFAGCLAMFFVRPRWKGPPLLSFAPSALLFISSQSDGNNLIFRSVSYTMCILPCYGILLIVSIVRDDKLRIPFKYSISIQRIRRGDYWLCLKQILKILMCLYNN